MARLPQATRGLRPVRPGATSSQGRRPWRGLRPLHPHPRPLHAISDHYTPIRDHFTPSGSDGMTCGGEGGGYPINEVGDLDEARDLDLY